MTNEPKPKSAAELVKAWDESGAERTSLYWRLVQNALSEGIVQTVKTGKPIKIGKSIEII